jgi:hypothetical protein
MTTTTIDGINYLKRSESNSSLIVKQVEGQTPLPESQASIDARSYELSERNGANAYIIPTEKDKVYLNFIAQKTYVTDQALHAIARQEFEYFIEDIIPEPDAFTLADGIIFRCVDESSTPSTKESYTYYIQTDGMAKRIPNYKTLEVMLAERNQNLLSVRVLEKSLCDQIPKFPAEIPDKTSSWKQSYADETSLEAFRQLENNAAGGAAIAESAKSEAQKQIDAVKAQAEASSASAAASQAQAQAANAAANAAAKKAEADSAAAQAAKAEAEAAKAEAEAVKAAIESGNF